MNISRGSRGRSKLTWEEQQLAQRDWRELQLRNVLSRSIPSRIIANCVKQVRGGGGVWVVQFLELIENQTKFQNPFTTLSLVGGSFSVSKRLTTDSYRLTSYRGKVWWFPITYYLIPEREHLNTEFCVPLKVLLLIRRRKTHRQRLCSRRNISDSFSHSTSCRWQMIQSAI